MEQPHPSAGAALRSPHASPAPAPGARTTCDRALEAAVAAQGTEAAFGLRLAGAAEAATLEGEFEIVALTGSVAVNGSHLHAALVDTQGRVIGGHLAYGCTVRTTAELLLALLPEWRFMRELDVATGYEELAIRRAAPGGA